MPLPSYRLDAAGVAFHNVPVDIIVCVHNALNDVTICLNSIIRHSLPPYHLIIVDDGSGEETKLFLEQFAHENQATLLRNDQAKGYTFAANQGLRESKEPFVILLNSDTIVTPFWLDRLIACANSSDKIGIVGPLSNTASWQSIPEIEQNGDWATNPLPLDLTVEQMGNRVGALATRLYPRLPFLNGFCLLIKRKLIENIGYFDEENFGAGYGEENDYSLRAGKAGWELAVADDVYIFHAQSKSYSHERRKQLADRAYQILVSKHGQDLIEEGVRVCRENAQMNCIRSRAKFLLERWHFIAQGQFRWQGKKLAFVLPITDAGGGGNIVIAEASAMQRMGVEVYLINLAAFRGAFELNHPHLNLPVLYIDYPEQLIEITHNFDAVIATANHSVAWLEPLPAHIKKGYYIQDFEPYFFVEKPLFLPKIWRSLWWRRRLASYYFRRNQGFKEAWLSYYFDRVRFTKTQWNQQEIKYQTNQDCTMVGASLDIDRFTPQCNRLNSKEKLHITAMVRPSSVRRSPKHTLLILKKIQQQYADKIDITIFGAKNDDPHFLALPRDFSFVNLELLNSQQIADLLGKTDIFVDFSSFQAMGLTAMEAMACGAAVIVPQFGGAHSFAVHQKNALIIDTTNFEHCFNALEQLIINADLRKRLMHHAMRDISGFYPEHSAYRMLEQLWV
jgi:GT2 family glycosyltransferase